MTDNNEKLLQDYAAGLLAGPALAEFEQRIQTEPALKAELDWYLAIKAIDNQRLKQQLLAEPGIETLQPEMPAASYRRWLALLGVGLVLLAGVWYTISKPAPPKSTPLKAPALALQLLKTPYPSPVIAMGKDTLEKTLKEAYLAYVNKDYTLAAQQLSALPNPSDEALFYTAESFQQTGQYAAALPYFDRIGPGYWREVADLRSAMVLLQLDETEKARKLLEQLKQGSYKKQAEALLEGF